MTTPLPLGLQALFADSSGETFAEWAVLVRKHLEGNSITVDDLCRTSETTRYRAELAGETYHFMCFYDAVGLAALAESAVNITTSSPPRTEIEARAIGIDSLTATPESVVTSFGVPKETAPNDWAVPSIDDIRRAVRT